VIEALSVYRAAVASNPVELTPSHPASLIPPKRPRCAVFEVLPAAADGGFDLGVGALASGRAAPAPFVAGDGGQLARLRDEQALADGLGSVANNVWCAPRRCKTRVMTLPQMRSNAPMALPSPSVQAQASNTSAACAVMDSSCFGTRSATCRWTGVWKGLGFGQGALPSPPLRILGAM
jgi:hypothetical protein